MQKIVLLKMWIKKLYKCFKNEVTVKFVLHYQTTKLCYFTNTKDKTPFLSQSLVPYKFVWPGWKSCHAGKTDRNFTCYMRENTYAKGNKNVQSIIYQHLSSCIHWSHIADLFRIDNNIFNNNQFNVFQMRENAIGETIGTF